jgi:hypothetical protein
MSAGGSLSERQCRMQHSGLRVQKLRKPGAVHDQHRTRARAIDYALVGH